MDPRQSHTFTTRAFAKGVALLALASSLVIAGCNYKTNKQQPPHGLGGMDLKAGSIDFQIVFKSVIDDRCMTCHDGPPRVDLSSYPIVKANLADIRSRLMSGNMPKGRPLPADELNLLVSWIDAGAPEHVAQPRPIPTATPQPTPAPGATPEPVIPGFQTVYNQVFDAKCSACHDGVDEFDISDYDATFKRLAEIKDRVQRPMGDKKRMPQKNKTLDASQMKLLLDWIDAGGPRDEDVGGSATPTPQPTPAPGATPDPAATPDPGPAPMPTPIATPTATPGPTPVVILPTYDSINENILKPRKCLGCHTDGDDGDLEFSMGSLGEIVLADQAAIIAKDPMSSRLIKAVMRTDKKRMPPAPKPALPPEEIEVLKQWIGLGCPP